MSQPLARIASVALLCGAAVAAPSGCIIRRTEPEPPRGAVVAPPPATVHQPPAVAVGQPPPVTTTPEVVSGPTLAPTGATASGSISYPSQRVRYPLSISFPRTVSVYVAGHGLDPTVRVFDGYGTQVGFNDDGGSGLDSNLVVGLAPGTYVIEVAGYGRSTGPFTLTVR